MAQLAILLIALVLVVISLVPAAEKYKLQRVALILVILALLLGSKLP